MMKPHLASLKNALFLVLFGTWGYFSSESPSPTAFIPVIIGILLIAMNRGLRNENKIIAHIVVVLTLIVFIGLIKPLTGAINRDDTGALVRVAIMMLTSVFAMITFIKSFIDARKSRK